MRVGTLYVPLGTPVPGHASQRKTISLARFEQQRKLKCTDAQKIARLRMLEQIPARAICSLNGNTHGRSSHAEPDQGPAPCDLDGVERAREQAFFTEVLGLRRVKKTVNFDAPDVYHLYYGDEVGTPGTVMTYFPFPDIGPRPPRRGRGRDDRLRRAEGLARLLGRTAWRRGCRRPEARVELRGEAADFPGPRRRRVRAGRGRGRRACRWTGNGVSDDNAIRGFHRRPCGCATTGRRRSS